jgi:hypothetical protein
VVSKVEPSKIENRKLQGVAQVEIAYLFDRVTQETSKQGFYLFAELGGVEEKGSSVDFIFVPDDQVTPRRRFMVSYHVRQDSHFALDGRDLRGVAVGPNRRPVGPTPIGHQRVMA